MEAVPGTRGAVCGWREWHWGTGARKERGGGVRDAERAGMRWGKRGERKHNLGVVEERQATDACDATSMIIQYVAWARGVGGRRTETALCLCG
jgi:hypothetical protein